MDKNADLKFNISATTNQQITSNIRFSTQDEGSAKLTFFLYKDGVVLPLNAVEGKLAMRMADGSIFRSNLVIVDKVNGVAEHTLTPKQLKHYGRVNAELYLNYDNNQKMSVHRFSFTIERALIDADISLLTEFYVDDFSNLKESINVIADETTSTIQAVSESVEVAKGKADETINLIKENKAAKQVDLDAAVITNEINLKKRGIVTEEEQTVKTAITLANSNKTQLILQEEHEVKLEEDDVLKTEVVGDGKVKYKNALLLEKGFNVGIPQNLDNKKYTYPNRIMDGNIIEAPMAYPRVGNKGLARLAHFYLNNGTEFLASAAAQANGAYTWYDWSWNHIDNPNYDPSRHPLLGWYRGDDPNVLDWICYWSIVRSNLTGYIITETFDNANWSSPTDKWHWVYQLMNNVKNFKLLKYALSVEYRNTLTLADLEAQHNKVVDTYSKYPNVYAYTLNGKSYAAVFCWDFDMIRGVADGYGGSIANTKTYLKNFATKMQNIGYDGICILARHYIASMWDSSLDELEDGGVLLYSAGYETKYGNEVTDYNNLYSNYANNCVFPTEKNTVINVVTSGKTQEPHPSGWNLQGSTPELFKVVLHRAVNHTIKNGLPRIITLYNISEWAEGGPGLIPNQRDKYGYLDAVGSIPDQPEQNVNQDSIVRSSRKATLTQSKEVFRAKKNDLTLNGTNTPGLVTTFDFGVLPYHNYLDNKNDYVYNLQFDFSSEGDKGNLRVTPRVDFPNRRFWVSVYNDGLSITGVGVSLEIKKKDI